MILERLEQVTVILATTRVLLGMDFKKIDIVIFAGPFNDMASLLQGGGRGGRRRPDGLRGLVQVYQLYTSSDYGANAKLTPAMRDLCKSASSCCTTKVLEDHFAVQTPQSTDRRRDWCCNYCDGQRVDEL